MIIFLLFFLNFSLWDFKMSLMPSSALRNFLSWSVVGSDPRQGYCFGRQHCGFLHEAVDTSPASTALFIFVLHSGLELCSRIFPLILQNPSNVPSQSQFHMESNFADRYEASNIRKAGMWSSRTVEEGFEETYWKEGAWTVECIFWWLRCIFGR